MPPPAAKLQQVARVQMGKEIGELSGAGRVGRRREVESRGGHGHSVLGSPEPAAGGPLADRLVAVA